MLNINIIHFTIYIYNYQKILISRNESSKQVGKIQKCLDEIFVLRFKRLQLIWKRLILEPIVSDYCQVHLKLDNHMCLYSESQNSE